MDLEKLIIRGRGNRYDSLDTCSVQLTFECIEHDSNNQIEYEDAYCVLHRVQIIPTTATDFMIDCPLDDDEVREHFEQLLSENWHGYPVHTAMEEMA